MVLRGDTLITRDTLCICMTNFELINGKHGEFILDITEINHLFVTEDETCAEITISKKEILELAHAMVSAFIGLR